MSEQNKLLPEALGTDQPCPTQSPVTQEKENEQEATADPSWTPTATVTKAPAVAAQGIASDRGTDNWTTEDVITDENSLGNQTDDSPVSDVRDIFGNGHTRDQSSPAPQTAPGAFAVPGIGSVNNDTEFANREQLGHRAPPGIASDIETPIRAHVANERGHATRTARNASSDDSTRRRLANSVLVSARGLQELFENPDDADVTSRKCSPRYCSRRTWAKFVVLMAIVVAAATLLGVLIPRGSTTAAQEGTKGVSVHQGDQPSAAPSAISSNTPSLLPTLPPTFDPDTRRFMSMQSILVPFSGLEVLLDMSTPQYRALEWVSLTDPQQLPYNTEADRKRIVQRYVLATLYYAGRGEYWFDHNHFLEGIHECGWWSVVDGDEEVSARGAVCSNGQEVDHIFLNNNNFSGTLPAELQHLELVILDVSWNNLGGPIPGFIGNMTSLEYLWLQRNSLTGTIPKSFGNLASLQELELVDNMLNGIIPSALGRLSNLRALFLNGNRFTGQIPNEICQRRENYYFILSVDDHTANGTEFSCECIPVEGLSGCCVIQPNEVGNGHCKQSESYNSAGCGWDGGDCLVEGLPECLGIINPSLIGDGWCKDSKPYNTEACGYDGGDCLVEELPECLGVWPSRIGNGACDVDEPYNTKACGYDGGDCCESTCKGWQCGRSAYDCKDPNVNLTCFNEDDLEGCCVEFPSRIGDGFCHPDKPYYTEVCKYDNGDCPAACPKGTSPVPGKNMSQCCAKRPEGVGDGLCDGYEPYNTEACGYDGGDCCESTCNGWKCGMDGYDCKDPSKLTCLNKDDLEGCCVESPSLVGDGYCHPYGSYYTEACKYDNGDCPATCPDGTFPVEGKNMSECCVEDPGGVGNGLCDGDEPYNTAACGWDGGDCCEETCEDYICGISGYNCKDPTISN